MNICNLIFRLAGRDVSNAPAFANAFTLCATKMRHFLTIIFLSLGQTVFAQTVESIDNLKQIIDKTVILDSISISDTPKVTTRPVLVKAYLKGDTLLKTIANFSHSSRLRITYYEQTYQGYATPLYVKDIDSLTHQVLLEVYGKDYDVYKSTIIKPLEEQEAKQPYRVLQNANFSTEIGFALVDRKADKYSFTGKLVKAVPLTPGCGTIAWAIVQKFEVIKTTFPNYSNKYVLIIQTCPEFLKKGFFQKGKTYEISVATNSGVTFSYAVINSYEKEKLPTFWTRKIKRTN